MSTTTFTVFVRVLEASTGLPGSNILLFANTMLLNHKIQNPIRT